MLVKLICVSKMGSRDYLLKATALNFYLLLSFGFVCLIFHISLFDGRNIMKIVHSGENVQNRRNQ